MTNEQLEKSIETITGAIIQLQARSHALERVLTAVAVKQGLDRQRIEKAIYDLTESMHQKLLERVENVSPELSAQIDIRTEFPDIPDALL